MDVLASMPATRAGDPLAAKTLDLVGRHLAELQVERVPRLELPAVDQKRPRAQKALVVLVEVPEQRQPPVLDSGSTVFRRAL